VDFYWHIMDLIKIKFSEKALELVKEKIKN